MKFASIELEHKETLVVCIDDYVIPVSYFHPQLPHTMGDLLKKGTNTFLEIASYTENLKELPSIALPFSEARFLPPIPQPGSFRDAYAFRQHVETSRRNRGLEMIPTFDEIPVFYFSNHRALTGPGPIPVMPMHLDQLDYELEVAIVIGRKGRNIRAEHADEFIAGMMILNDVSARGLQMQEMKLNLGPAKGKDFASSFGPFLVTMDELKPFQIPPKSGHRGNAYQMEMKASINGTLFSHGNLADMHWTFAEIIERASYGVDLYPGDIIGSGTVGTGCLLELNGTARLNDPHHKDRWLQVGDTVTLEVEGLGQLTNQIIES
jgi:fumarylacetoacetate (FAA) hydrolase